MFEQMGLFDFDETIVEAPKEPTPLFLEKSLETVLEKYIVDFEFIKDDKIKHNGEEGVFLHPYSQDGKTSAIRLGKSYIVVLTSAIERI